MAVATAHEVDLDVLDIGLAAVPAAAPDALDVDPDGLFVFCDSSGTTARTQGGFCLHCGACNHDYL
jgi:hypothetical protein